MGRKLRVDFSNEQKTGDDDNAQVSRSPICARKKNLIEGLLLTLSCLFSPHLKAQQTELHTLPSNRRRCHPSHQERIFPPA